MAAPSCRFLLTFTAALVVPLSLAFNVDVTAPDVYTGEPEDFFGYKVLQFTSGTNKGIIVTAPLQRNGSGGVCKPDKNQAENTTLCFSPQELSRKEEKFPVKHLGLSIAADPTNSHITVCSPSVAHECNDNLYVSGVCYNVTDQLTPVAHFTPTFQECTKKTVDLVFLFDGSLSMTEEEFAENKAFIMDIMQSLNGTSIKFAAVQFSSTYRKVFDFNDYQAGSHAKKLEQEPHMAQLTNTYDALKFVLADILGNPQAGASRDATKVLVLITDGDPSDSYDKGDTLERYDKQEVIRFVIAVKAAKLDKFTDIASQPTSKYAFQIEDYNGLTGILQTFQKKIFKMEGSTVARAGDLKNEMSQSGFSSVFYKDTLILGSVGTKMWRGALQELHDQNETQIEDPRMQNDSYLGYSVSVGERAGSPLYFTGAPRYEHKGQILVFRKDGGAWIAAQRLNGSQIGSYFGAELCSVDIDSDGDTDFLLVGAPMFYQPAERREGQVHVYTLTDEVQLKNEVTVTAPSVGRFGTTISSLADLNGDGLRDVAVGAPLEDDHRGAVYIYLGHRKRGIRSTSSQRISGQDIHPGLRLFGLSIDGGMDLGEDGLPDIVIGSQGTAVVLRTKPVFNIVAHVSFHPEEISTEKFDCVDKTVENLPMGNVTACFEMVETTNARGEAMSSGLNISYMLNVDPTRQTFRGFFSDDRKARNLTSTYNLTEKEVCFTYPISMPKCVKDTLTPVSIKLNFFQVDKETVSNVLNVDSRSHTVLEIPFERQCANNDMCVAELGVDFNFTTPTLLVAEDNYFNISIQLSNRGDDSYNTNLTMFYPLGLSFSGMSLTQKTRPTLHSCDDLEGVLDRTVCGISRPVYRSKSAATFNSSFYIMIDSEWNDTVSVTVTGRSDNANVTTDNSVTKVIPVQYEVKMVLTVKEDTTTYLNFTSEDVAPKKMEVMYKISNPGFKAFPVVVSLFFPTQLEHNFEMKDHQITVEQNKTQCNITDDVSGRCSAGQRCKTVLCDAFVLDKESTTDVTISGHVHFKDLKKKAENIDFLKRYTGDGGAVTFTSFMRVQYDARRYVLDARRQQNEDKDPSPNQISLWKSNDPTVQRTDVRVEFTILPNQLLIILTGVGVGVLLLFIITIIMLKLGCFRRKRFYEDEEETAAVLEEGQEEAPCSPAPSSSAPQNGTASQSETELRPEEKKLLDD